MPRQSIRVSQICLRSYLWEMSDNQTTRVEVWTSKNFTRSTQSSMGTAQRSKLKTMSGSQVSIWIAESVVQLMDFSTLVSAKTKPRIAKTSCRTLLSLSNHSRTIATIRTKQQMTCSLIPMFRQLLQTCKTYKQRIALLKSRTKMCTPKSWSVCITHMPPDPLTSMRIGSSATVLEKVGALFPECPSRSRILILGTRKRQ